VTPFARSNWDRAWLVCAKCSRKLDGGFGPKGKTPLAKALRRELGVGKGRKASLGVVEVKCLGVCPKRAVTLVDSADPHRWHLVEAGEDVAEVARKLMETGDAPPPARKRPRVVAVVKATETVVAVEDQAPPA
jgi:predicted metal-binding protein